MGQITAGKCLCNNLVLLIEVFDVCEHLLSLLLHDRLSLHGCRNTPLHLIQGIKKPRRCLLCHRWSHLFVVITLMSQNGSGNDRLMYIGHIYCTFWFNKSSQTVTLPNCQLRKINLNWNVIRSS